MKTIACLGSGDDRLKAGNRDYDAMVEVGRLLAEKKYLVATGGYGGIMEAVAKGAKEAGGATIGYTMLGQEPNQWIMQIGDCAAQYHIGFSTPPIPEIQYGMRLGSLLSADSFIICAGGGPGAMVELMAIVNLNAKLWKTQKRLAILNVEREKVDVWNHGMLQCLGVWGFLSRGWSDYILVATTPEQGVSWVTT